MSTSALVFDTCVLILTNLMRPAKLREILGYIVLKLIRIHAKIIRN